MLQRSFLPRFLQKGISGRQRIRRRIAIREVGIAGRSGRAVRSMPAVQRTAPMPEPVAGACARHQAGIALLHPRVDSEIAPTADVALRQPRVLVGSLLQHPARLTVAEAAMEPGHFSDRTARSRREIRAHRTTDTCAGTSDVGWYRAQCALPLRKWPDSGDTHRPAG